MEQAQQNRRAVLIVEDDAELREFAARLLKTANSIPSSVKAPKLPLPRC